MINSPIYKPKGRAREYCDLAVNIYTGCNHGCYYCFARKMKERYTPKDCVCSFGTPEPRPYIVESVERQLSSGKIKGQTIQLCFSCDPYPADIDTTPTREIIKAIKDAGNNVQILTKGGYRAERDFDLLDGGDWFGVTISAGIEITKQNEPNAAGYTERIMTLIKAHKLGIKTWVSCEPVFEPERVYSLIQNGYYIDLFKIGKTNYVPSNINWCKFGKECKRLCEFYHRDHYIKEDLQAEMELINKYQP